MYLSPGWSPSFGGALHMADEAGGDTRVEATYNSIVVFDVQAENSHLVAPIEGAAGETRRLTIGGWYPKPAGADSAAS
jgi:Rps23 Pro-64 3,4-dihydroxylase Tpa1-like proline 4-hydroxylase